jgi:hypothetical protein
MSDFDPFKIITGQTIDEFTKLSDFDEIIKQQLAQSSSDYPLRLIGTGEKDVWISEEERYVNYHILGAPGEGKSKFLEHEIRQDIDNNLDPSIPFANSLCFIDGSERGDTVRNILDYCAKVNYQKVILIDPTLSKLHGRIPKIAALTPKAVDKSVAGVMEALGMLFGTDYTNTRRIKRNLSALLRVLARKNLTLYESIYFSILGLDADKREAILGNDRDSFIIRELFRNPTQFDKFESTINIMDVFWHEPIRSMVSNKEGIKFINAVRGGWVILVNLSTYALTEEQSQLLGIMLLIQMFQAIDYWVNQGWEDKFYLYVDEAGYFANKHMETALMRRRKSGLRMYLAHQNYTQFDGKQKALAAVESGARIKMMFNVPEPKDRLRMVNSLNYGGAIPPAVAAYANSDLPKQYCVIKKNKNTPVRIRIPDVEPVAPAPEAYIKKILSQSFYKDAYSIRKDTESPKSGKVDDTQTDSETVVPGRVSGKLEGTVRPSDKKPPQPPPKRPIKI